MFLRSLLSVFFTNAFLHINAIYYVQHGTIAHVPIAQTQLDTGRLGLVEAHDSMLVHHVSPASAV